MVHKVHRVTGDYKVIRVRKVYPARMVLTAQWGRVVLKVRKVTWVPPAKTVLTALTAHKVR